MNRNRKNRSKRIFSMALAGTMVLTSSVTSFAYVGEDKGVIKKETQEYSADVAKRLSDEGIVLLENEMKNAATGAASGEAALPLKGNSTLAVFGAAQNKWTTTSFYDGLDENFIDIMEGIENNDNLTAYAPLAEYYSQNSIGVDGELDASLVSDAAANSDAALIVINRKIGEGSEGKAEKGSYYLTDGEEAMIDQVNAAFDKTIVVFNTAFTMDMQWVKDKNIDASIWAGNPGNCGGTSVADILTGVVNPSGHLVDTYAKSWDDYPSSAHWADSDGVDEDGNPIVYYTDDIYVGYRYFETFHVPVTYEFGYGLSYTDFEWSNYSVSTDNDGQVTASVTVKNVGDCAGKDVVELYYSYPDNGVVMEDVPSIQLIQYGKTKLLQPGESETLKIKFDFEDMALFNETSSAYVIYAGAYQIKFGHSVKNIEHTENLASSFTYNTKNITHYMTPQYQIQVLEGDKNASSLGTVTRRYDEKANSNNASVLGKGEAIDEETYNAGSKGYTMTQVLDGEVTLKDFVDDLTLVELTSLCGGAPDANFGKPTLNGEEVSEVNILTNRQVTGRTNGITARELVNLTMADRQETIGYYNESAWGANEGSYGFYVFPSNTVNAATWNQELMYEYGAAMGNECKDAGINYFLGISMNIHRNPLGGRNSEYYSEDPIISGLSGTAAVKGVQSKGVIACIKHFVCNNQETNRQQVNEIISERALREIYLKGFQMTIEDGNAMAVMTSYNKVNGSYSPENNDLLNGITRGEWGFKGLAMTDWGHSADLNTSIVSGNDLWMSSIQKFDDFYADVKDGAIPLEYVKLSAARVLQGTLWVNGKEVTSLSAEDFQNSSDNPGDENQDEILKKAEEAQKKAEEAQKKAEEAQKKAEQALEEAKKEAENAQASKKEAESALRKAEAAQAAAEKAKIAAEEAWAKAEKLQQNTKTVIKVKKKKVTVKTGKTVKLQVSVNTTGKITYKSANKKIAKVSSRGVIKGVRKGSTNVTVKCNGVQKKVKVTVK